MNLKFIFLGLLLSSIKMYGQNSLVFSVANSTVNTGSDFVTNVQTQNFTDVSSFSFSMSWDKALIDFDTIIIFNGDLPLSIANFNITSMVTNTGKLSISWFDLSGLGKSLSNNTTLFEIKFRALANSGSTLLAFTEDLTPIVAENLQGVLPVSTIAGTMTVQAVNSTSDALTWGDISIYPNPAKAYALIQYSNHNYPLPVVVEIMDLNGKLVRTPKYENTAYSEMKLDVTSLPSGTYIIRMVFDEGIVFKKLSIAR